jgi:hypothetical protein
MLKNQLFENFEFWSLPVVSFSNNSHLFTAISPSDVIDSSLEWVTLEGNHVVFSFVIPDNNVSLVRSEGDLATLWSETDSCDRSWVLGEVFKSSLKVLKMSQK